MRGTCLVLCLVALTIATSDASICPKENPVGQDVLLPAEDCQHFYKCDHGKEYLMECPTNQEWSQELQRCDWPEIAQCSAISSTSTNTPSTSKPTTPKPTPTPTKPTKPPTFTECPKENPIGQDVLLPAEDCQHFYKCDHGHAYKIPCPENQEWSQELQRCDWPEVAQCSGISSTSTNTPSASETTTPTPTKPTKPPTFTECPKENPIGQDVLLPAEDCQHFYKCDHGHAYKFPCPENQEWSQEVQRCDWPEVAQCSAISSTSTNTPSTSETTTPKPTPTPTKPTKPPTFTECPKENPVGQDVLLPAEDCQHFYKCDHGHAYKIPCPVNQEWSQELQRCDWPEVAQCSENSGEHPHIDPTTTIQTPSTDITPTSTSSTTESIPSNICPNNNNEGYETLLAIPGVCDRFYKCDFGKPKIENCPFGTKFSHTMLRCDFPDVANCIEGVTGIDN